MKENLPTRQYLFLMITLFVSIQTVHANQVTRQQALQHAHEFLQRRGLNLQQSPLRQVPALGGCGTATENAPYYVFNIGNDNGFVIASGDDCAYEILGYAGEGHYDADNIPDGMKSMLDFYAEQIGYGSESPQTAKPGSSPVYPAVDAMLTTKWGQSDPYNLNCPIDPSTNQRCVTGCVATAIAQLMYYHREGSTREIVKDIPGYMLYDREIEVGSIPKGSPIDWDNMLDTYASNSTEVQRQAVANLMLYCGTAVKMEYGPSSSGATNFYIIDAFINYFDYDDDTKLEERNDYTNAEWETMVYEELGKGHPLFYAGGRHAFVVDGHDGNGFVHINWGWNGTSNGHFRLTATYAGEQTMGGYASSQTAVFGAVPNGSFPRLSTQELTLTGSDVVDNLSSISSIPVSLSMTVANLTGETGTFEQAVGLYKLGKLLSVVSPVSTISGMAPGATSEQSVSFELESTLPPGVYALVPVSRLSGAEKWRQNGNPDQFVTLSIYGGSAHLTVGVPEEAGDIITFACDNVRKVCVQYWDLNGDGAFSKEEAATVTSLEGRFKYNQTITSFDELQYFTGLTSIANSEFINCYNLSSLVIPPNVESIGNGAFRSCKLQQVIIPRSVTSMGENVFNSNKVLKDLYVESGNPVYDSRDECHAIIETATNRFIRGGSNSVIPDGVVAIADYAFAYCEGLKSIQIPETVTSIAEYAFYFCSNLLSVNIPDHVTSIGYYSFSNCSSLTEITVPSSVTSMGNYAFSHCPGLTSVNLLPGLTVINTGAFQGCAGLTSFTIPSSVTSIGSSAFSGCTGLTSITFPSNVTSIGAAAFSGCTGLLSITIPETVSSINGNPFYGCSNLQSIAVDAGNAYYESDGNNSGIIETATKTLITGCAHTVIPNGVLAIGSYAFYNCSGLTSIVIPSGVTTINSYAFYRCFDLTSVALSNSLTNIGERAFTWCTGLTDVTIPSGVTSIGEAAFCDCINLQSINIPAGVTKINNETFSYCSSLTSINIPMGVTSIGKNAFCGCEQLTSITIPSSVTSIGNYAFQVCTGLTSIKSYITNVFRTGTKPFNNCNNAILYVPKGLVDVYSSTPDWDKVSFIEEMQADLDVNGDGNVNIADVTMLISMVLGGDTNVADHPAADCNEDGSINIADVTALIGRVLKGSW